MPPPPARERFLALLRDAMTGGTLEKLTLGKYRGADATLRNLHVRPVQLKGGSRLAFTWRHATRDITKNHTAPEALAVLEPLVGSEFLDAHLFTTRETVQFETKADGTGRLKIRQVVAAPPAPARVSPAGHDRSKSHPIAADSPWLQTLGITNERGQPRVGMADKFRQIQKFAEVFTHLLSEAGLEPPEARECGAPPLRVVDMGSGKGYLTFTVAALLGSGAQVIGIEARPELVELCQRAAARHGLAPGLAFAAGTISNTPLEGGCDVLIALHACDTATDDALARGLAAGARLLIVAPCCQKELRPQLTAPAVLTGALRHGIFQERQAEFATDALRAMLLEWAGFRTKVFEFISTDHTAKNLMIVATRSPALPAHRSDLARAIREFSAFFGIKTHALARHLSFTLADERLPATPLPLTPPGNSPAAAEPPSAGLSTP